MPHSIALIGDYAEIHLAHRAIPAALSLAAREVESALSWRWIHTRDLTDAPRDLAAFSGVWVVPASPYENTAGALAAIRFARETGRAFLGTCGGFQHALIEFARDVAGIPAADHAETNPSGADLVVTRLSCSLAEQLGAVQFTAGSLIATAYGRTAAQEGYRCNYGVNPERRAELEAAGLRFTAFDPNGDIRGAELPRSRHPFFVGTLFQPERAALRGELPPLVRAFVAAILATAAARPPR